MQGRPERRRVGVIADARRSRTRHTNPQPSPAAIPNQ
jgi:hypothetical protein